MRTCKLFRYLLAAIMAIGTATNAMADEVEFLFGSNTVELKKNGTEPADVPESIELTNIGTCSYLDILNFSTGLQVTGNAVLGNLNYDNTGSIVFGSKFKYEVNSISWRRWTENIVFTTQSKTSVTDGLGATIVDSNRDWVIDRNEPSYTDMLTSTISGISQIDITVPKNYWQGIIPMFNHHIVLYGLKVTYTKPDIRIRFADGKKGYDISVGDTNCKIEGYISNHAGAFLDASGNLASGVTFDYESSDPTIASVTSDGTLTGLKEGDVTITAKLMNEGVVVTTYSYPLHVFVKGEGLAWNRHDTWYKSSTANNDTYQFGGATPVTGIDWTQFDKLKVQTTIWENEASTETDGAYKQIVGFNAPSPTTNNWRAAVQKLSCKILVPKYTKVESTLKFGANTTLGTESKSDITYGYEFVDLGIKTDATTTEEQASAAANTRIGQISWDTKSTSESATSVGSYRTDGTNGITYLRNGAQEYRKHNIITAWNNGEGYVGDHYTAGAYWNYDNSTNGNHYDETRFFAAMVYLQNQINYSATSSFGYQDIPTYTYCATVKFDANKGKLPDGKTMDDQPIEVSIKNGTVALNPNVFTNAGLNFVGWNTKPDGTGIYYPNKGDFCPYDDSIDEAGNVLGGGKGPVTLYAQWSKFTTKDNVKSYCSTEPINSITVGELVHNDDYTFSYGIDASTKPKDADWQPIGKMTSSTNNQYRVGFQLVRFATGKIPAYTSIEARYDLRVISTINGTSTEGHGGEIFASANGYEDEYGSDFLLNTANGDPSNKYSLYKQWAGQKDDYHKTFIIDCNANSPEDKNSYYFHFALMASTRTDMNIVHTANYWYKSSNNKKFYHAYITFDPNGGTGSMAVQNIKMESGKTVPLSANKFTRTGYVFAGWSTTADGNVEYVDKGQFKSYITGEDNVKRGKGPVTLYAVWKKVTVITLDRNGAPEKTEWGAENGQASVEAIYGDAIPMISSRPSRPGYEYQGYYDAKEGGTLYYQWNSVRNWDKDVDKATLYAHWSPKTVRVTFNYTDPSKKIMHESKQIEGYVTGSDDKASLGTSVETPTYEDYIFDGWYEQDGKNKTYDADGNAVEGKYWIKDGDRLVWQSENDVQLYPQWIKDATIVDVKVIRSNNYEGDASHNYVGVTLNGMTTVSNFRGKGYITVDGVNFLSYEKNGGEDQLKSAPLEEAPVWTIQSVEGSTEKVLIYSETSTGRKYLGNKIANGEVMSDAIGIQDDQPEFYFTIYNEKAWICLDDNAGQKYNHILYMKDNTAWEYENTGDNPQYKPIRILAYGTSSSYGNLNSAKVVKAIKDKLATKDENGKYPYAYNPDNTNDLCKGLLYVDMGGAASIVDANANDLSNFKNEASANCLFFVPNNYTISALGSNVVCKDGEAYEAAANLVITDKVPFSSPYEFSVDGGYKASYTRNNTGTWGSMCLPFPVKNEGTNGKVRFYQLYGSDNIRLAYKSVDTDDIPANSPIAYNTSMTGNITFENSNITVPADPADLKEKVSAFTSENIREFAKDSENEKGAEGQDWNVVGVRFYKYIYGSNYTAALPSNDNVGQGNVYYFSNGKFSYVNPNGYVRFAPFRVYYQPTDGSGVKSFSVIALDEESATDITDVMTGAEAEGDGKIYDLQGRRVKTPLKGHIYIVNGKKKQY